jgi:hypothetical protein
LWWLWCLCVCTVFVLFFPILFVAFMFYQRLSGSIWFRKPVCSCWFYCNP